ncbi:hypothetical protein KC365_g87 [Hortaea werneckii]|nr:hypothetical protein KC365_g87 [Hortaea werneckii]
MHLMKAWTVQVTWRRSRFLSSEGILTSAGFLAPHKAAENCSRQKHETAKQCSNDVVTIEARQGRQEEEHRSEGRKKLEKGSGLHWLHLGAYAASMAERVLGI